MTEQEKVQLLPCPFCGGEARFVDGRLSINIRCGNYDCGITQRQYYYETTAEAIAAWNTRHTATAAPDLLAALIDIVMASDANDGDSLTNAILAGRAAIATLEGEQP